MTVAVSSEDDLVALSVSRLKKRAEFLRVATGRKGHAALFTVQGLGRVNAAANGPRVGFTVTKRVGNAVERNRIKRRLREVVRRNQDLGMIATHDYVIVARRDVLAAPFSALGSGLKKAVRKIHSASPSGRGPKSAPEPQADVGAGHS